MGAFHQNMEGKTSFTVSFLVANKLNLNTSRLLYNS